MIVDTPAAVPPLNPDAQFDKLLGLVADSAVAFSGEMDLDKAMHTVLTRIAEELEAEGASLFERQPQDESLICRVCVGPVDITGLTLPAGTGIVGETVETGEPIILRDAHTDPRFAQNVDARSGFTTRSILSAPLQIGKHRLGALQLINKSTGDGLFDHTDLVVVKALASAAGLALLNARLANDLVDQQRTRRELELAAEIQRSLMPPRAAPGDPVHGVAFPARAVSGDLFDTFRREDGQIVFALADVSGKGMNASILMTKTISLFRVFAKSLDCPGKILNALNDELCETAHGGMFVTMSAGLLDPETGATRIANAGHEPTLVIRADDRGEDIDAGGPPLGILPDVSGLGPPAVALTLKPGDALYLFSDGVTEGEVEGGGDWLGRDGIFAELRRCKDISLRARINQVAELIARPGATLRDDVTLLGVSLTPDPIDRAPDADATLLAEVAVPGTAGSLRRVRQAVRRALAETDMSRRDGYDVLSAIDEACQNIVRYGYDGGSEATMVVRLMARDDRLIVHVKDHAARLDPDTVTRRDLDEVRPGGLGTHIIDAAFDTVEWLSPPAGYGNLLRLERTISRT